MQILVILKYLHRYYLHVILKSNFDSSIIILPFVFIPVYIYIHTQGRNYYYLLKINKNIKCY